VQVRTINSNGLSIVVRKWWRICTCTVNGSLSAATAAWAVFNSGQLLPAGFRPAQEVYHYGPNTLYIINTNGEIYMSAAGGAG